MLSWRSEGIRGPKHGITSGNRSPVQVIFRVLPSGTLRIATTARVGSKQNSSGAANSNCGGSLVKVRSCPEVVQTWTPWDATLPVFGIIRTPHLRADTLGGLLP